MKNFFVITVIAIILSITFFANAQEIIYCIKTKEKIKTFPNTKSTVIYKIDNETYIKSFDKDEIEYVKNMLTSKKIDYKICDIHLSKDYNIFNLIPDYKIDNSTNQQEKNYNISKGTSPLQPYAKLSLEILNYDKEKIKNTLNKYRLTLPYRDKLEAEIITGQIWKAYKTAYINSINSKYDYLSYKQNRDLYMTYANNLNFNTELQHIEDVSRVSNRLTLKKYLRENLYFLIKDTSFYTYDYDSKIYDIDSLDHLFSMGFYINKNRADISTNFGIRNSIKTFPYFDFSLNYTNNKYLNTKFSLGLNSLAEETNYLFYGGMKDFINLSFDFKLNNKNTISSDISFNNYASQERNSIGFGFVSNVSYTKKLRVTYPDYTYYIYLSQGIFNEKNNLKGTITEVSKEDNFNALPDNYIELGVGFQFGFDYYSIYNRRWRPFLDTSIGINDNNNLGYSIFTGLGGSVFKQDNLAIGVKFAKGFFGQDYNIYNIELNYNIWF